MRTSIFIADSLWEKAQRVHPNLGASALVRTALRQMIQVLGTHDDYECVEVKSGGDFTHTLTCECGEQWTATSEESENAHTEVMVRFFNHYGMAG